ncbi:hypothetical protein EDD15DRAFT_2465238 [Pisolithus albus]|nr:hypothetical protein EDD15DRAFT_2465238 [Pisolithus albus]
MVMNCNQYGRALILHNIRKDLTARSVPPPRRATDVYRAREARFQLGLPPIADDLLIESTALPTTNANWNLETLGDSVLKLITTSSMSNRALLACTTEIERFLTSEGQNVHVWRYTVPEGEDVLSHMLNSYHAVQRSFPRRSLQDCMEATLGAAFLTVHLYGGPHQSRGARMLHRRAWKTGLKLYYWNENFHFLVANIKVAVRAFGAFLGEITAGQNNRVKTRRFLLDVIKASANSVAKRVQEGQWGRGGGTGEQSHACGDVNHKIEIASTNKGTSNS